jgi:hypothetical protein
MALKRKIEKGDYEALSEAVRPFYVSRGDAFVLDLDTSDDEDAVERLRRSKDAAAEEARQAREDARKAREEAQAKADEAARKSGDISALEKSWGEKLSAREAELQNEIKAYRKTMKGQLLESTGQALASELFGKNAKLGLPHIQGRLSADFDESGAPVLRVLDTTGKASALTLEDLRKEFLQSGDFASIIRATEASGGGSSRRVVDPLGTTPMGTPPNERLSDMSPDKYVALISARKAK